MPIIHGATISPYVRKVLIVLEHKGIQYEVKAINPFKKTPELMALHPLGKIPVYQEDDFILPDSSAICSYLEKQYPTHPIYPSAAKSLGKCIWYESYADALFQCIAGKIFFNKVVAPKFLGKEGNQQAIDEALNQELPVMFAYLEQEIGTKEFLVDDQFTLADISMFTSFVNFKYSGCSIDQVRYPNLAKYIANLFKHPSIIKVLGQEKIG
ncbi:MAG: Glutathione S-transferase-like protein [Gammaproteobacteria bacterium]|jgi:glutathione S-transferase|nr:Glutathione S-transferase-like protein [Gammaproteobacteria bacterium]